MSMHKYKMLLSLLFSYYTSLFFLKNALPNSATIAFIANAVQNLYM